MAIRKSAHFFTLRVTRGARIHEIARRVSLVGAGGRVIAADGIILALLSLLPKSFGASSMAESSYIDKLALVHVRDRKQLVARTHGKLVFFTPGGKREGTESDADALIRECKEELTVDLRRDSIQPYGVFEAQAHGKAEGVMVRMTCYTADFDGELQANEEIEELRWITSACDGVELSVTGMMILKDLKAKGLID